MKTILLRPLIIGATTRTFLTTFFFHIPVLVSQNTLKIMQQYQHNGGRLRFSKNHLVRTCLT